LNEIRNPDPSAAEQLHRRIGLLAGVATDTLRFSQPGELLLNVCRRMFSETSVDLCLCYSVRNDSLRLLFATGIEDRIRTRIEHLEFGANVCGVVAAEREPVHPTHIQGSENSSMGFLKESGIDAFSCYPLLTNGRLVGTLAFGTRRSPHFETADLEIQHAVADQLAIALHRLLLIEELAAKNRKLSAANSNLRRANTELEQFAFSASHDLREPIRHIGIYAEILRRKLEPSLDSDARQSLNYISSNASRLDTLVRDLLAYTNVIGGPQSEAEIDSGALFSEVIQALDAEIKQAAAAVRVGPLPELCMNEDHLKQLFIQLLHNALKFRRPGVPPEIDISYYQTFAGPVICVRDNGVGIAPEHQDKIFGLFKRLHAAPPHDGTGLGLAICQKIVERYDGQIWVESEPGKGALFCVRLGAQTLINARAAAHHSS
jgi:signal transduction histidine kinase